MTPDEFRREYSGTFPEPADAYRFAYEVWLEYHTRVDGFEMWRPLPWGRGQVSAYAARLAKAAAGMLAGVPPETVRAARDRALDAAERGEVASTYHLAEVARPQPSLTFARP